MKFKPLLFIATASFVLVACQQSSAESSAQDEATAPATEEAVSIIRPDIEQPELPEEPLEPLEVTIGFPDGGAALDANAKAALRAAVASPQMKLGLPIILRAHGDSAGDGDASMRSAEERGLAVAAWLIENGINEDRIEVIVFGGQNPIAPNALPDGSPDEEGRAQNRRVEIEIPSAVLPAAAKTETGALEASD